MTIVIRSPSPWQFTSSRQTAVSLLLLVCSLNLASPAGQAAERPKLPIADADATTASEMKSYVEKIQHTDVTVEMVPIPGGPFVMGSPDTEEGREEKEGPQHKVSVDPFWMAKYEITWDVYEIWMFDLDIQRRRLAKIDPGELDIAAEEYQISQPTTPYTDMTFGMGKKGYPAICMTQFAARTFCQWLTAKTGRYYRLPTEAEWEYACRAAIDTAYSFGDDPEMLDQYAWYYENSDEKYHQVGKKKPNPWGLYDMHGNVAEWVLDQYKPNFYAAQSNAPDRNPLAIPVKKYPRIVRGGSWDDDPEMLRSAARMLSSAEWKLQDPQFPKSIWYHTDALHVGFRIVRPLREPDDEQKLNKWDKSLPVLDRKSGR